MQIFLKVSLYPLFVFLLHIREKTETTLRKNLRNLFGSTSRSLNV